MKPNTITTFFLGSAILFASCTKETLQSPETPNQLQGAVVSSNATLPTWKTTTSWGTCGGTVSLSTATTLTMTVEIIDGSKSNRIQVFAYKESGGSLISLGSAYIIDGVINISFTAQPSSAYYLRLLANGSNFWLTRAPLNTQGIVTIPGTIPGSSFIVRVTVS